MSTPFAYGTRVVYSLDWERGTNLLREGNNKSPQAEAGTVTNSDHRGYVVAFTDGGEVYNIQHDELRLASEASSAITPSSVTPIRTPSAVGPDGLNTGENVRVAIQHLNPVAPAGIEASQFKANNEQQYQLHSFKGAVPHSVRIVALLPEAETQDGVERALLRVQDMTKDPAVPIELFKEAGSTYWIFSDQVWDPAQMESAGIGTTTERTEGE
jgi:hypothetical protein